jgi:hypothetical protein
MIRSRASLTSQKKIAGKILRKKYSKFVGDPRFMGLL